MTIIRTIQDVKGSLVPVVADLLEEGVGEEFITTIMEVDTVVNKISWSVRVWDEPFTGPLDTTDPLKPYEQAIAFSKGFMNNVRFDMAARKWIRKLPEGRITEGEYRARNGDKVIITYIKDDPSVSFRVVGNRVVKMKAKEKYVYSIWSITGRDTMSDSPYDIVGLWEGHEKN